MQIRFFIAYAVTERKAFIPIPASRPRGGHLLPHERHRHREANPREPGLPQGRHARLQEGGEEPRHPESVSAIPRETLICTVLCNVNLLFIADAVSTL